MKPTLSSIFLVAFCAFLCAVSAPAQEEDDPLPDEFKGLTADQIVELVRLSQALQHHDLSARLSKDGTAVPLGLSMRESSIYFKFRDPDEILELQLRDDRAVLNRETRAGKGAVPAGEYGKAVRGTDVTLEDLSMRFLYWPKPVLIGEERIKFKKCWVLRVNNPDKTGPYATVLIWVHQGSGALLQMEGYGHTPSSKPVKRFRVSRVQKDRASGTWILREMSVESVDSTTGKRLGETRLEVRPPEDAK